MTMSINSPRMLYHMVRADFLERVRRYSFLLTLAAALYLAYGVAAEKIWIVVGNGYRGVYNSAWIGALMTICCSTFLSLAGFYIVKNSVQRDTDTRVGQILAATPMRKDFYTLAKTLSNFAILACMIGILMLAALVMQLMRAEAHSFSLWKLWSPFIFMAMPTMLLTASVAVLFETLPVLRGGVGNVIYFFAWTAIIALGAQGVDDPSGLQLLYRSARSTLQQIDPSDPKKFSFSLTIGGQHAVRTFAWSGFDWTAQILLMRLAWVATAIGMALLASFFFHRFDPARAWRRSAQTSPVSVISRAEDQQPAAVFSLPISAAHLTPLVRTPPGRSASNWRWMPLVVSELRLMLQRQRWWWYVTAAGLVVGQLASPERDVRSGFLLAAWIWPILLWSQMGCRETRYSTGALLFSSERSLSRQFPALWMAGVLVALLTGAGIGVRLALAGDWHSFSAWIAGALFIPSLALALGVWRGGSRAFEAIYTVWWYMGPAHQMPGFDFMGTTPASSSPAPYALAAAGLVAIAWWRRRSLLGYA
jgi:MYXO-CTERM domain-containing protein